MSPAAFEREATNDAGEVLLIGERLSAFVAPLDESLDGARVVVESDAAVALARLAAEPEFDCVVVDHDPPATDGLALLESARAHFPEIPLVLCVSDADERVVEEALAVEGTDVVDCDDDAAAARLTRRVQHALRSRRTTRRLRRTSDRLLALARTLSAAVLVVDEEGRIRQASGTVDPFGYEEGTLVEEAITTLLPEFDVGDVETKSVGGELRTEGQPARRRDGTERRVRVTAVPTGDDEVVLLVREGGDGDSSAGTDEDYTEAAARDGALARVDALTRRLAGAETPADVAETLEEAARTLATASRTTCYLLDREAGVLQPATGDEAAVGPDSESPVWEVFVGGETAALESPDPDDEAAATVAVPLGGHGVLVVRAPGVDADGRADHLIGTLTTAATQALDRLRQADRIRTLTSESTRRTERRNRLDDTVRLLLAVVRAVTNATERDELDRTVCETLVERDRFSFVWIGVPDEDGERLVPQAWAGTERGYFEGVDLALDGDDDAAEPAARAAREWRPVHVPDVADGLADSSWRQRLSDRGHRSVLSLPLVHDGFLHGVLTVCADTGDAFGERSRRVLGAVADGVAHASDALESRLAIGTDRAVELGLRIDGSTDLLGRLARAIDATVTFEDVVTNPQRESMLYVSVRDASVAATLEYLRESSSVTTVEHVGDVQDGDLFALGVAEPTLVSWVTERGAAVQDLRASPTATDLTVELPRPASVRSFVEGLRAEYPAAELLTQRSYDRQIRSRRSFMAVVSDRLTDRQLEVLKTAYLNGYFEWPRTRTGEEIAALLDITQPTFNNHLRVAERKILTSLFERPSVGGEHT